MQSKTFKETEHLGVQGIFKDTLHHPICSRTSAVLGVPACPHQDCSHRASRPPSHGQPYREQDSRITHNIRTTSGGFSLPSVSQGFQLALHLLNVPLMAKYQKMWLLKIPGNTISIRQLSDGHASTLGSESPSLHSRSEAGTHQPSQAASTAGQGARRLKTLSFSSRENILAAYRGQYCTSADAQLIEDHQRLPGLYPSSGTSSITNRSN